MSGLEVWHQLVESVDSEGRPKWEAAEFIVERHDAFSPQQLPFGEYVRLIDYIYRLGADLLEDEERMPSRRTNETAEGYMIHGFSQTTALRLSCLELLLTDVIAYSMHWIDVAREWHHRIGTHPAAITQDEIKGSDVQMELLAYCANDTISAYQKFTTLLAMGEIVRIQSQVMKVRALTLRRPDKLKGRSMAYLVNTTSLALTDLAQYPASLLLFNYRIRDRLQSLCDGVRNAYAEDIRKDLVSVQSDPKASTTVIIDPMTVLSVASIELVLHAIRAIEGTKTDRERFAEQSKRYQTILRRNRPGPAGIVQWDFTNIHDFVVPPEDDDRWPGGIPEVEHLARRYLLNMLQEKHLSELPKAQQWCFLAAADGGVLGILVPGEWCAPIPDPLTRVTVIKLAVEEPLLAWLLMPITTVDSQIGGYFRFQGQLAGILDAVLKEQEQREQLRKFAIKVGELTAVGGGALFLEPLIMTLLPGASPAAVRIINAVAGHLLVELAKVMAEDQKA